MIQKRLLKKCPCCGSSKFHPVMKKTFAVKGLSETVGHAYVICSVCRFLFTQDPLTDKALEAYYRGNIQERREKPDAKESEYISSQLDFLLGGLAIERGRVLEIGANNGGFLDGCRDRGFKDLFYSEYNADSRRILAQKPHLKDLSSLRAAQRKGAFDLIVLLHTLEHIVEPAGFIRTIASWLRKGGALFVEVPDFTIQDGDTDALIFEHVNFFSEPVLRRFFQAAGLTVVSSRISLDRGYPACPKYVCRMLVRKMPAVPTSASREAEAVRAREKAAFAAFGRIDSFLKSLPKDTTVGIYSASWLTGECLRNTTLTKRRLTGLYDRDRKKWGTEMSGVRVNEPRQVLSDKPERLLILNEGYENEIKSDLIAMGFPKGKIVGWSNFIGGKS